MADEERKDNQSGNELNEEGKFNYRQLEDAVKVMTTPSVAKILTEQGVDMTELLPQIYIHTQVIEGDTIDTFALRCIDTALAFKLQENFKRIKVDSKTKQAKGAKEDERFEFVLGDGKDEDDVDYESSTMMMDKIVKALKRKSRDGKDDSDDRTYRTSQRGIYGMSSRGMLDMIDENGVMMTPNKDGSIQITTLEEKEKNDLLSYMSKICARLHVGMVKDGLPVFKPIPTFPEEAARKLAEKLKEEREMSEVQDDKQEETGLNANAKFDLNQVKSTMAQFYDDPKLKEQMDEYGVTVDSAANFVFNNVKAEPNEDVKTYTERALELLLIDKALKKEKVTLLPKLDEEKKRKINEDQTGEMRNSLFGGMGNLLKLPFEMIKELVTGESAEDRKARLELVNLKGVPVELNDFSRTKLIKRLNEIESGFSVYDRKRKLEDPKESKDEDNNKQEDKMDRRAESDIITPEGRRKIIPKFRRNNVQSRELLQEIIADFDKLDLDDSVSTMAWVSDLATITSEGFKVPEEARRKIVEKLEEHKYTSNPKARLPEKTSDLTIGARKAFLLTQTSRMLGEGGKGILDRDMVKDAEMIIARENPDMAREDKVFGEEAGTQRKKAVDRSKFSVPDSVYQQKIDKLMKDFETLDLTDSVATMSWLSDFGETAAHMESIPDIDKAMMSERLKQAKIDIRKGAEDIYSSNSGDKEEATTWAITTGAIQILDNGKIEDSVIDKYTELLPERDAQPILPRDLELDPKKVEATRGIVHETMENHRGNREAQEIVESMRLTLHPELEAAMIEEEKRREKEAEEYGHPLPTDRGGLGSH